MTLVLEVNYQGISTCSMASWLLYEHASSWRYYVSDALPAKPNLLTKPLCNMLAFMPVACREARCPRQDLCE